MWIFFPGINMETTVTYWLFSKANFWFLLENMRQHGNLFDDEVNILMFSN